MPQFPLGPEKEESNPHDRGNILPTEQEVQKLKEELARKEQMLRELKEKERPVPKKEEVPSPEIFERKKEKLEKEKIKVIPEKVKKAPPSTKAVPPPKLKDEKLARDLQSVMALDKPKQVKMLVFLAFKKGINYAVNLATQLRDPYLLDEFHDTLVDHLYELLVKKRKIK